MCPICLTTQGILAVSPSCTVTFRGLPDGEKYGPVYRPVKRDEEDEDEEDEDLRPCLCLTALTEDGEKEEEEEEPSSDPERPLEPKEEEEKEGGEDKLRQIQCLSLTRTWHMYFSTR